jgi:hypothetical protein
MAANHTPAVPASVQPVVASHQPILMASALSSRGGIREQNAEHIIKTALGRAAGADPAGRVSYHLGNAGLTMDESVERVRGTLQRAVDVLASGSNIEVDYRADSSGRSTE